MKSISFKNFRRFTDFPEFKFGDITILVGGNNAGKSTVVKALLLILDNIRTMRRDPDNIFQIQPDFRFDKNQYHDLSIGSFAQALNRNVNSDKHIEFSLKVEEIEFDFYIVEDKEAEGGSMSGKVNKIVVTDTSKGIKFIIDFATEGYSQSMQFIYKDPSYNNIANQLSTLKQRQKVLSAKLSDADDNDIYEIPDLTHELSVVKDNINKLTKLEKEKSEGLVVVMPIRDHIFRTHDTIIIDLLENFLMFSKETSNLYEGEWPSWATPYKEAAKSLNLMSQEIQRCISRINEVLSSMDVTYIQAHGVSQRTLYKIGDTSDFAASTLTDFVSSRAYKNKPIREFIQRWMRWFNIGHDFKIDTALDEAFTVSILENENDSKGFPMAHLGMGSIQLMILLFGLATQMKNYSGMVFDYPTIIIEEPEQNLHPALQSKLADLFSELTRRFSFRFIIETHSEYLVRRSQVLMADPTQAIWYHEGIEEVEDMEHPFKVYYFPNNGNPYDMKYREDGCFAEEFGTGFFDEASNQAFKLF